MQLTTPLLDSPDKTDRREFYTSLDAMKFFAIVNMTIDHIGCYFFPDAIWLRALGRITFPVWFFLVGYSRAREIPKELWFFAALLVIEHLILGSSILPVNALCSVILCRLVVNFCEQHKLLHTRLPEIMGICVILSIFTVPFFEYGSMAFLFAIYGRLIREKITKNFLAFMVVSYLLFIGWQISWWHFNWAELLYVVMGTAWVVRWLAHFSNDVIWREWRHPWWKYVITVLSRNTALYYFMHRMIFEIVVNI